MPSRGYDPLKLYYIVVLGTDAPTEVTPFQGFSVSWRTVGWALQILTTMPADVLERSYPIDDVTAQRMGGLRALSWAPLSVSALETIPAEELGVFVILFSGEASCAERVADWAKKQTRLVLHISRHRVEQACYVDDLTYDVLQTYCGESGRNPLKDLQAS
jgi:hypothetical protein